MASVKKPETSTKMKLKTSKTVPEQDEHKAGVDADNSDSELEAASEASSMTDQDSDSNRGHDSESDENQDFEENSDEEMDRLSIDDNLNGADWMDVDADESDSNGSSSSNDESNVIEGHLKTDHGDPKLHGNMGWADAMAKILRTSKPKGKKSIVLAKAKKLSQISNPQKSVGTAVNYGFEIDGKEEKEDIKPKIEELDEKPDISDAKPKVRRRDQLAEGKVKPSILQRERERALSKIATKGVVQLFNAVREQQKDINCKLKEAKGSVRKEEKVLKSIDKRAFLDVLMGNTRSENVEDLVQTKNQEGKEEKLEKPATWSVLRDNYLTGSNLKDWDKCGEIKLEDNIDEVELN